MNFFYLFLLQKKEMRNYVFLYLEIICENRKKGLLFIYELPALGARENYRLIILHFFLSNGYEHYSIVYFFTIYLKKINATQGPRLENSEFEKDETEKLKNNCSRVIFSLWSINANFLLKKL